jgi:hypothetical protein
VIPFPHWISNTFPTAANFGATNIIPQIDTIFLPCVSVKYTHQEMFHIKSVVELIKRSYKS